MGTSFHKLENGLWLSRLALMFREPPQDFPEYGDAGRF